MLAIDFSEYQGLTHSEYIAVIKKEWLKLFSEAKKVTVPMTLDESRKEFPYRPFLTQGKHRISVESHFGGTKHGDLELLRLGEGEPCKTCSAPTEKKWLSGAGICPDCDGRAETNGYDPHQKP